MVSERRLITKTVVDRLKPGELVWDTKIAGFCVRCQRRDKVYSLKYRHQGRQRWMTIGRHGSPWTVERARREATSALGEVADGNDPAAARQARKVVGVTIAELADQFLEEHADAKSKPSTAVEYRRIFKSAILPQFGKRSPDDVGHDEVKKFHYQHRGAPYAANRMLAVLSKFYTWTGRRGERNPCVGVERYEEHKRRRYPSAEEMQAIGAALVAYEEEAAETARQRGAKPITVEARRVEAKRAADAIRLLIFTGARKREILTAKREYFRPKPARLELPDSKTGAKTIYLNAPALAVLEGLEIEEGSPYYFPSGKKEGSPWYNLTKPWQAIRTAAGCEDMRLHDLRHGFASVGVGAGLSLPLIGGLLGHTTPATTARYAHLESDPLQAASSQIGKRLAAVMAPKKKRPKGKVVAFKKRSAAR